MKLGGVLVELLVMGLESPWVLVLVWQLGKVLAWHWGKMLVEM